MNEHAPVGRTPRSKVKRYTKKHRARERHAAEIAAGIARPPRKKEATLPVIP